ncbi:MAG: hypothetical protein LBS96_09305 [Oscillospiraceae bacterium]|jgi:hypothetical protein|nr:hypothetical protein [Oscillospiraceae bacterium]
MFNRLLPRILALLVAPLCLFTAWITDLTAAPPADTYAAQSSENFGLFEAIPRYQGVTTDGKAWYYSWNYGLQKTDLQNNLLVSRFIAIPLEFLRNGNNHIGDISYYDGKIYAPLEDGSAYLHPYILLFDAETLAYTGVSYALPQELHLEGVPWVAVDGARGVAYTAEWHDAAVLNVFSLTDFSLVRTQPLSQPLDRIQGAEIGPDGLLYCAADTKGAHTIWAVNPEDGAVAKVFDRVLDDAVEAEGITVLPMADGSFLHCTETGASRVNVVFKHYALPG